jgi:hypothetical protein
VQDYKYPGPGKVKKRRVRGKELGSMPDMDWGRRN